MTMTAGVDVLEPELWLRVHAAAVAVNAKIDQRIAEGGWIPSARVPTMSRFDSGWPSIHVPLFGAKETPDYSRLFGLDSGENQPFTYSDVPELNEICAYVLNRPDLRDRMSYFERTATASELEDRFLRVQAASLVLSIVDRARALGKPDDETAIVDAYIQRERAIFALELEADVVAPLIMTNLDLDEPLDLENNLRIERLEEAVQLAAARTDYVVETVPPVVSNAATHALVILGAKVDNFSLRDRVLGRSKAINLDKIDEAIECLRIAAAVPTGYAQVLLRPHGWADSWTFSLPAIDTIGTFRRYPSEFDNYGWLRSQPPIAGTTLGAMPTMMQSASAAPKATKLAMRRLTLAELRENHDDRVIDACIGIEALLSNENTEIAHKIATRGATVLATRLDRTVNAKDAFRMFKTVYARRSDLVHGTGRLKNIQFSISDDDTVDTASLAVFLLRELLRSLLAGGTWTIADLDDDLLASLDAWGNSDGEANLSADAHDDCTG